MGQGAFEGCASLPPNLLMKPTCDSRCWGGRELVTSVVFWLFWSNLPGETITFFISAEGIWIPPFRANTCRCPFIYARNGAFIIAGPQSLTVARASLGTSLWSTHAHPATAHLKAVRMATLAISTTIFATNCPPVFPRVFSLILQEKIPRQKCH